MFYTYAHSKPYGSVFYIGKGSGKRAWDKHQRSEYWNRVANKHGVLVEILAKWKTEKEAFDHEMFLISCFNDLKVNLVNHTLGGEGPCGMKHSEEAKLKIGKASSFRVRSEITKQKSSLSQPKSKKCVIDGIQYHSVGEAARKLKISQPSLSNWLNQKTKPSINMNIKEYGWLV